MVEPRLGHPNLGLGVGLRTVHFPYILEKHPPVEWFDINSEKFIDAKGRPRYTLDQKPERNPIVLHVGLFGAFLAFLFEVENISLQDVGLLWVSPGCLC